MSADTALHNYRQQRLMSDAEAIDLLLEYIDNQQSDEAFADFLDNQPAD